MTDQETSEALGSFVLSLRNDPFYASAIDRGGVLTAEDKYAWLLAKTELAGAIRLLEVLNPGCSARAGIVVPAIFEMKS